MNTLTLHVLVVVFVATLIRSAFGFGEALVAVPLLALRLPVSIAAPLAVLLSITTAGVVVSQDWRQIHLRSAALLVGPSLFGIPVGLWLLKSGEQRLVKAGLAVIILAFSAYSLFAAYSLLGSKAPELKSDSQSWLLACGFCAGVLGGAFGMNGPPLVIYGSMRRWSPQRFRATLQAYFLPASVLGMAGYWLAGLWVPAVTDYYLLSLPVMLPAILLGRFANRRMRGDRFLRYVYFGLAGIGAVLLAQAIRRQ